MTKINDIVVAIFITLTSLLFLNTPDVKKGDPGYSIMNSETKFIFVILGLSLYTLYQFLSNFDNLSKYMKPSTYDIFVIVRGLLMIAFVVGIVIYGLTNKNSKDEKSKNTSTTFYGSIASAVVGILLLLFVLYKYTK